MSRHRNIRSMNYNEEYDTYYDVYGQSVEEEGCISPRTAAQFLYDRTGQSHSMSAYLAEDEQEALPEEPEEQEEQLSAFDQARLQSCLEEIQNIVGETVSEAELKQTVIQHDYDITKALDAVLKKAEEPKPQRVRRERQRQDQSLSFVCDTENGFLTGGWGIDDGPTMTLSELLGRADSSKNQSLSQLLGNHDPETDTVDSVKSETPSVLNPFSDHRDIPSQETSLLDVLAGCDKASSEESNIWSDVCAEKLSLSLLADLCQPLQLQQLTSALQEFCLSDLALKPTNGGGNQVQKRKSDSNRTYEIVTQYLANFPHDLPKVQGKLDTFPDLTGNVWNEKCPSLFGFFLCTRLRTSKRVYPQFRLSSNFAFDSPSPDDVTLLKRTDVNTA